MNRNIDLEWQVRLISYGIEPARAYSIMQDVAGAEVVSTEAVNSVLEGFDGCVHRLSESGADPLAVWIWFSKCHVPALGGTLLKACLECGEDSVSAYVEHWQNGGYA